MLAISDPAVHTVTVKCCTQLMKTEFINNVVGFFIDQDPCPMIVMQPTVKLGEAWSKDRLDKMLRDSPALKEAVGPKKGKDSSNTILHKEFPGGHLTVVGSNAPGDLAMRPVRVILCDEVDKYPQSAGDEGDPIKLVTERAATFWNKKIVHTCSPTIEGKSRITMEYDQSDQRIFEIPCAMCTLLFEPQWKNVKWTDGDPETAKLHCDLCDYGMTEVERLNAIQKGKWRATEPFNGHAGFQCSKMVSPWESMTVLAKKFISAKKTVETLKTFINTQLAETWKEKGEVPEWRRIYERRENYTIGEVPEGVIFLSAGVDVQKDRLEVEICGYGLNKESWSVDYRIFHGRTDSIDEQPWKDLEALLGEGFPSSSGYELPIRCMAVDTGYNATTVYDWTRKFPITRVIAVKGFDHQSMVLGIPKSQTVKGQKYSKHGVKLWPVGVSVCKAELYGWLNQDMPTDQEIQNGFPFGFCHFPQYQEEYFKQLTGEMLTKRLVKGFAKYEWQQTRDRNEALDCRNYARAAAARIGMDRWRDKDWELEQKNIGLVKPVVKEEKTKENKTVQKKRKRERNSSIW